MSRAISRSRGYGVTELTDGRFRARANLPPDDNGQRRQRTQIVASKIEADQWAQELLVSERHGSHIERATDSFNAFADDWLLTRESAGLRPVTARG
jgi:hypothetical protein